MLVDFRTKAVNTEVPLDLKNLCEKRIDDIIKLLAEKGFKCKKPTLSYDLKGTTAGMAYLVKNHIGLNGRLLLENKLNFIANTVGHEMAHLITFQRYGAKASAHGKEWAYVMRLIGQPAIRCHSFNTDNVKKEVFKYYCKCDKPLEVSKTAHKNIFNKKMICRACKTLISTIPLAGKINENVTKPSTNMIQFAHVLAVKSGIEIKPETLKDFKATAEYIKSTKSILEKKNS